MLLALGHRGHGDVDLVAPELRQEVAEAQVDELEPHAEHPSHLGGQVGLEADDGPAIGGVEGGRGIGVAPANPDGAALEDGGRQAVVQRLSKAATGAARSSV